MYRACMSVTRHPSMRSDAAKPRPHARARSGEHATMAPRIGTERCDSQRKLKPAGMLRNEPGHESNTSAAMLTNASRSCIAFARAAKRVAPPLLNTWSTTVHLDG